MKWSDRLVWSIFLLITAAAVFSACGQNPKSKKQVSTGVGGVTQAGGTRPASGTTITDTSTGVVLQTTGYVIESKGTGIQDGVLSQRLLLSVDGALAEPTEVVISVGASVSRDANGNYVESNSFIDLNEQNAFLLNNQNIQISTIGRCAKEYENADVCEKMYVTTYIWTVEAGRGMTSIFQYGFLFDGEQSHIITMPVNQTTDFDSMINELKMFDTL